MSRQSLDEISCTFTDSKTEQRNPETCTVQSVTLQSCQRVCHKRQRVLGLGFSRRLGHKWLLLLLSTSKILLWECVWFAHTKSIHLNPSSRVQHPGLARQRCPYFVSANQRMSNRKCEEFRNCVVCTLHSFHLHICGRNVQQGRQGLSQYFTGRQKNISRSTCTPPQQGGFQMESALMHWFFHSWTKKTKHSNFSFKKTRSWLCCFHGCISAFLQRSIQHWNSCRMFSPLYQPHPHHLRKKKNNRRCRRIYAGTISERLILTDELCRNKNMMEPFFPIHMVENWNAGSQSRIWWGQKE